MLYAAYGSNLHPLRLTERIASAAFVTTAFLPDWSLQFHKRGKDGSGKCNIVSGCDGVHVAVFEASTADKRRLDTIEGVGFGYSEAVLDVPGVGECHAYVAEQSHVDDALLPYDWYRDLVLWGGRFHGFPRDYVQRIALLQVRPDLDVERSARARRTIERNSM